jgi:hypothetical protein
VLNLALGIGVCQALINEMLAGFVITPSEIPVYWCARALLCVLLCACCCVRARACA